MKIITSSQKIALIFVSSIAVTLPFIKAENASISTQHGSGISNSQEETMVNNYKLKFNETCRLIDKCIECEYAELFTKTECHKTGLVDIYNCDNMVVYQECMLITRISRFILFTILIWFLLGLVLRYFMRYRKRLEIEMINRIIGDDKNWKKN